MKPPESREDLLTMQQDAIRRVREMQQRANRSVQQSNQMLRHNGSSNGDASSFSTLSGSHPTGWRSSPPPSQGDPEDSRPPPLPAERTNRSAPPIPPPDDGPECSHIPPQPSHRNGRQNRGGFLGLLDGLGLEDDTLLILLLLYVLWKNDADHILLMALAYILL